MRMHRSTFIFGLLAAVFAGAPALAEISTRVATQEFAAQSSRPRVTIYPRNRYLSPSARRHCRAWLAKEYRVSGTVIVPRQYCWWQ